MYELDVLVNGKSIVKYPHQGQVYIEGRKGTEYSIRIKNNSNENIIAVVSVDGLSVMDGKEASFNSIGYVVDTFSVLDVPGWRLDNDSIARFKFGEREEAYADQKGAGENVGVIGCAFFRIKPKEPVFAKPASFKGPLKWPGPYCTDSNSRGLPSEYSATVEDIDVTGCTFCATNNTGSEVDCNSCDSTGEVLYRNVSTSSVSLKRNKRRHKELKVKAFPQLGTEFGTKQQHLVQEILADRMPDPEAVSEIHYDSREGLERRGIRLRKEQPKIARAFKEYKGEVGCKPPKNWRG